MVLDEDYESSVIPGSEVQDTWQLASVVSGRSCARILCFLFLLAVQRRHVAAHKLVSTRVSLGPHRKYLPGIIFRKFGTELRDSGYLDPFKCARHLGTLDLV